MSPLGVISALSLNLFLYISGALTIAVLVMLLFRNKSIHKRQLEDRNKQIRKLRQNMTLRSKRNHELESQVHHTSEQLNSHDEFQAALNHLIGHDLKNAMHAIMGTGHKQDDRRLSVVKSCGDLAFSMIRNMLDVQRFEKQQVSLQLGQYCLHQILESAKAQVSFLFSMKRLELLIDVPQGVFVQIDSDKITRTFVNLLVNAVKYSKVGAKVRVVLDNAVQQNGAMYSRVSVEDEGAGIAQSRLPFLFDKHWKRDTKDIGKVASAGLGLVYCKYVLEAHGGEITVSSKSGKGTRFDLLIPYLEANSSNCGNQSDKLSIMRAEVAITDEELKLIRQHGKRLNRLKVYEITRIREVIDDLDSMHLQSDWTHELGIAVYQGDQQKYDKLIEMVQ